MTLAASFGPDPRGRGGIHTAAKLAEVAWRHATELLPPHTPQMVRIRPPQYEAIVGWMDSQLLSIVRDPPEEIVLRDLRMPFGRGAIET